MLSACMISFHGIEMGFFLGGGRGTFFRIGSGIMVFPLYEVLLKVAVSWVVVIVSCVKGVCDCLVVLGPWTSAIRRTNIKTLSEKEPLEALNINNIGLSPKEW